MSTSYLVSHSVSQKVLWVAFFWWRFDDFSDFSKQKDISGPMKCFYLFFTLILFILQIFVWMWFVNWYCQSGMYFINRSVNCLTDFPSLVLQDLWLIWVMKSFLKPFLGLTPWVTQLSNYSVSHSVSPSDSQTIHQPVN